MGGRIVLMCVISIAASVAISWAMTKDRFPDTEWISTRLDQDYERELSMMDKITELHAQVTVAAQWQSGELNPRWWCFAVHCTREKATCELNRAQLSVDWASGGAATAQDLKRPCEGRHVAFCQGRFCYRELGLCLTMEKKNPAWPCLGVE